MREFTESEAAKSWSKNGGDKKTTNPVLTELTTATLLLLVHLPYHAAVARHPQVFFFAEKTFFVLF